MKPIITCTFVLLLVLGIAIPAHSQSSWGTGRISVFAQGSSFSSGEDRSSYQEISTYFSLYSPYDRESGMEYGVDLRSAAYPGMEERATRFSLYSAYVGYRTGALGIRAGQVWINELGALGSVGGVVTQMTHKTGAGKIRYGAFGGKEPEILQAGYVPNILKMGGFFAVDAENGRSHAVGYVNVRNTGVTERSVLVFTNYLPAGNKLFIYQAAELDLSVPARSGSGGLNYFFINARGTLNDSVELQGTYHRGRSIDSRSITDDELNGRPVDPSRLTGFLYESAEGRVTVRAVSNLKVFAGYGQDRTDREDGGLARIQYGFFTPDAFGSGVDLRFSGYRYTPQTGPSYGTLSFSAGKMLGRKVYLSGEYTSSLAVLRATLVDGVQVVHQPRSARYSIYSLVTISRALSLQFTLDHTTGEGDRETRFLAGFTFRL